MMSKGHPLHKSSEDWQASSSARISALDRLHHPGARSEPQERHPHSLEDDSA
jgi:hypothetical protein